MLFRKGEFAKAVRGYDKFMDGCDPNSELYMEALERQFFIAKEFLAGRKKTVLRIFKIKGYAEGEAIMGRINRRAGEAASKIEAAESGKERAKFDKALTYFKTIMMDADVEVAKSYEKRGRFNKASYDLAYFKWFEIFETYDGPAQISVPWPTGAIGKDALFGMARCKYEAYNGPMYDTSEIGRYSGEQGPYDSAQSCYEEFKSRWPEDAERIGVDKMLEDINRDLALKQLSIGLYYQKTGNRLAANLYYSMVIRDWPDSEAADEAREKLTGNLGSEEIKK